MHPPSKLALVLICLSALVSSLSLVYAGTTTRVSVASDGTPAEYGATWPSISADGRYVAFSSWSANLVSGDANDCDDVFVHDRVTGETICVSVSSSGQMGNGSSHYPAISADGSCVAFWSEATNLVASDTNECSDVFVYNCRSRTTVRVSASSTGEQGNGESGWPTLSADGRICAYISDATNLVPGDTNGHTDVFLHDALSGQTERISISSGGAQANGNSGVWYGGYISISGDGRFVTFASSASNLVFPDVNNRCDVFIRDRNAGQTGLVSRRMDGIQGNGDSCVSSVSLDGRFVAFDSDSDNLVENDANGVCDVFVLDRTAGHLARISRPEGGGEANGGSDGPYLTPDGRYVTFESDAGNLVPGDTNEYSDLFLLDRMTGAVKRVSVASDGSQSNDDSEGGAISNNGKAVAFWSYADNLLPPLVTEGSRHIYVRDLLGVGDTQSVPDDHEVALPASTVTALFPGCLYVEEADRSSGVRVLASVSVIEGDRYRIDGTMATDTTGERYINAWNVRRIDANLLPLNPLGMNNRAVGGGQGGFYGASGLNNIGLLIRTWGKVAQVGEGYLYLDDGSGLRDGTSTGEDENVGVRVICDPSGYLTGDKVEVTGISSCFWTPSGIARRILTRRPEDVRKLISP